MIDLDLVHKELEKYPFAEARIASGWKTRISLENGNVNKISSRGFLSIGFRVLVNGSFGFASTSDPESWRDTLAMAAKLAGSNPRPKIAHLSEEKVYQDKWVVRPRKATNIPLEDKVKLVKRLYKSVDVPSSVKTVDASFFDGVSEEYYLNSEGAFILQKYPRTYLSFNATAKRGSVARAREAVGGLYGLEIFDRFNLTQMFQEVIDRANALLKAKRAPTGKHMALVDPDMAGVFAHEAVGHACEGDAVVDDTSILKDKLGETIGSELVTIVDDATLPRKHGSYGYDDEGVPGQRTVLVENGVLVGFMQSRETAAEMGLHSTGNARAQNPSYHPIVRMSNTFFERGDQTLDELMEDIKFGVYVHGMRGGVTDPTSGHFQFAAEYGEIIKDGEPSGLVRDIVLSGNFLQMLHKIDAVGKDLVVDDIGTCGKSGQHVPVGDGGPHIRLSEVLLG